MIAAVGAIGLREYASGSQAHGPSAVRSLDLLPLSRILAAFPPRHAQALARQFSRIRQQAAALDAATERQLQCLLAAQQEQVQRWQAHALQQKQRSDEDQQRSAAADAAQQPAAEQPSSSAAAASLPAASPAEPLSTPLPSQMQMQSVLPASSSGAQPVTPASGIPTGALLPVRLAAMCRSRRRASHCESRPAVVH